VAQSSRTYSSSSGYGPGHPQILLVLLFPSCRRPSSCEPPTAVREHLATVPTLSVSRAAPCAYLSWPSWQPSYQVTLLFRFSDARKQFVAPHTTFHSRARMRRERRQILRARIDPSEASSRVSRVSTVDIDT
jgi:hypothetical protein